MGLALSKVLVWIPQQSEAMVDTEPLWVRGKRNWAVSP